MPLDYYLCGVGEHCRAKQAKTCCSARECKLAVKSQARVCNTLRIEMTEMGSC